MVFDGNFGLVEYHWGQWYHVQVIGRQCMYYTVMNFSGIEALF